MAEHTPGPWEVHPDFARTIRAHNVSIASIEQGLLSVRAAPTREQQANAQLIASAPALLEALETCEDRLSAWAETEKLWADRATNHASTTAHQNRADNYGALTDKARAALALARGELAHA